MSSAVKVNEPTSRRCADLDVLEETHRYSAPASARRRTMIGDSISHSTTPAALRIVPLKVTMPVSGRLLRNPGLRDVDIQRQVVARPQRRQPAHLVDAGRAERGGAADKAVEQHPHHDRAEMPARTGQPLQHRRVGGLLVQMHRLRIEFGGEGQNLLARDVARSERAEMAGREIFEGQRVIDRRCGLRIAGGEARLWPLFAAISTRPPAWLVRRGRAPPSALDLWLARSNFRG